MFLALGYRHFLFQRRTILVGHHGGFSGDSRFDLLFERIVLDLYEANVLDQLLIYALERGNLLLKRLDGLSKLLGLLIEGLDRLVKLFSLMGDEILLAIIETLKL